MPPCAPRAVLKLPFKISAGGGTALSCRATSCLAPRDHLERCSGRSTRPRLAAAPATSRPMILFKLYEWRRRIPCSFSLASQAPPSLLLPSPSQESNCKTQNPKRLYFFTSATPPPFALARDSLSTYASASKLSTQERRLLMLPHTPRRCCSIRELSRDGRGA